MDVFQIPQLKHLEPYFRLAETMAKESPCIRRQYGALVISYPDKDLIPRHTGGFNTRVGKCCKGDSCARTRFNIQHGQRVEVGGEIHAETAALINGGPREPYPFAYFLLVGFSNGEQLFGRDVWPCHSCAMQIKFAGFTYIYIRSSANETIAVNISQIIEEREAEWEPA